MNHNHHKKEFYITRFGHTQVQLGRHHLLHWESSVCSLVWVINELLLGWSGCGSCAEIDGKIARLKVSFPVSLSWPQLIWYHMETINRKNKTHDMWEFQDVEFHYALFKEQRTPIHTVYRCPKRLPSWGLQNSSWAKREGQLRSLIQ